MGVVDESVVVGVLLDDVVLVEEPVGLVDVVDELEDPLEDDEEDEELGLDPVGEVAEGLEAVPVVDVPPVVEDPLAGVEEDEVLEDVGGLAISPLWFSAVSTCCWTVATWEATAAGVPPAPNAGRASSCFRACSS